MIARCYRRHDKTELPVRCRWGTVGRCLRSCCSPRSSRSRPRWDGIRDLPYSHLLIVVRSTRSRRATPHWLSPKAWRNSSSVTVLDYDENNTTRKHTEAGCAPVFSVLPRLTSSQLLDLERPDVPEWTGWRRAIAYHVAIVIAAFHAKGFRPRSRRGFPVVDSSQKSLAGDWCSSDPLGAC